MNPFQIIHDKAERALLDDQPDWRIHREHALIQIKNIAEHELSRGRGINIVDQVKSTTIEWIGKVLTEIADSGYIYPRLILYSDLSGKVETGLSNKITLFSFPHVDRITTVYQWWKKDGTRFST